MLIVDKALRKRLEAGNPIRVGMIGAGYSGRHITYQILKSFPAIRLVAIANRTVETAEKVYKACGVEHVTTVATAAQLDSASRPWLT